MNNFKLTDWLPTTKKELDLRGWESVDVILFSGDAYVDHPSFGAAVIGRVLENEGLHVAIVPQPNWRDDLRDFKKLGKPRLFFAVSPGAMDSMVNHYTANKRLRSDDAYTPGARAGMRPDYPTIVYSKILKDLFPDVPVVVGGIEASLRRLAHYDYWQDRLRPSVLSECGADLLIYGMGEKPVAELAKRMRSGEKIGEITDLPQTVYLTDEKSFSSKKEDVMLFSYEECLQDKLKQARNFKQIEEQSNRYESARIVQRAGNLLTVVNPPYPPMSGDDLDAVYDLPFTRLPHPKYKDKPIPAYEMIKFSVNIHRGCFGGCAFCTISAHQGKFIVSRSKKSILEEVGLLTKRPDFKGYLSDLGGPSANMYKMSGKDEKICRSCKKPSCIHPVICPNLNTNHQPLSDLYKAVDKIGEIKKSFVGSGIRYDLLLYRDKDEKINQAAKEYTEELITRHVSGRLKVAPEHSSETVLQCMRKPSFRQFEQFNRIFEKINQEKNLNQQLIPYFISSHPACREEDMAELAAVTKSMNFKLEQVQDFTPTPMTLATEMYYTGYHPYTLEKVFTATTKEQKSAQREFFFWYRPEYRQSIINKLKKMKRFDLIKKLF
ncbi:MAG: YgiQ family radical SAM protein [Candidatus Azobacteroides sp.]|nr:YgiQ family radical SAM protein [Candidatus Azobacteroides sp.]